MGNYHRDEMICTGPQWISSKTRYESTVCEFEIFINLTMFQGKLPNGCMNWAWFNCRHAFLDISFQWKVMLKVYFKEWGWAEIHAPLRHEEAQGMLIFMLTWWGIYINSLNKSHLNNLIAERFYWGEFGFLRPGRRSDQYRTQLSTFSSASWFRQFNHALGH